MGVAATTTEASISAIKERLDQLNVMLSCIAARQDQMLVDLKKSTAALMPTTTTTPLSSTPTLAGLNLSLRRGKQVDELSGSSDAHPPAIACLQKGMERSQDTFARQMEATAQALTRISGVKAFPPTLSAATHHGTMAPTVAQVEVAHVVEGPQIPAAAAESTHGVAASALAAPLLLMDRIGPTKDQKMVLHLDAPKVFEEIPTKTSAAVVDTKVRRFDDQVMADGGLQAEDNLVAFTTTRRSTLGLGVGPDMSAFTREATLCASPTVVVLDCELKHDAKLLAREVYDGLITHVGGRSLFPELGLYFEDEELAGTMPAYQLGPNSDTDVLPWDPGQQKFGIEGLFGWRRHAQNCVSQCNLWVDSRSAMDAHAFQLVTNQVMDTMPPWARGGFSPGDIVHPRQYKCRDFYYLICFGCYVKYKQWDPGVWYSTNVTKLSTTGTCDTGDCISGWRNKSDLELKDSVNNTTLFCYKIGVPVSAYGTTIVKLEQAQYANCSKSVYMIGHRMLGLSENADVLLDVRECAIWEHVLAGILSWSYMSTEQIIKSTKLGHFNILEQFACCWECLCSTYCFQSNPCEISVVEANLVLKED